MLCAIVTHVFISERFPEPRKGLDYLYAVACVLSRRPV